MNSVHVMTCNVTCMVASGKIRYNMIPVLRYRTLPYSMAMLYALNYIDRVQ